MPTLFQLPIIWGLSKTVQFHSKVSALNDKYVQVLGGLATPTITWQVQTAHMSNEDIEERINLLSQYGGYEEFLLDLDSLGLILVRCSEYQRTYTTHNKSQLSLTLLQSELVDCPELETYLDTSTILNDLNQAFDFIARYTTNNTFMFLNADQKLPPNAMHTVLGRDGYFPSVSGTAEGIFLVIIALMKYYELSNSIPALTLAQQMYTGAVNVVYKGVQPPAIGSKDVRLPHWLYAAKGSTITKGTAREPNFLNGGIFNESLSFTKSVGRTWIRTLSGELSDVYKAYSVDGTLLWKYVYSPLISGINYTIDYWIDKFNRKCSTVNGRIIYEVNNTGRPIGTLQISINSDVNTLSVNVVYAVYEPQILVNKNECLEAFPFWRRTLSNEFNHAMDVSNWAYVAYELLFKATNNQTYLRALLATKTSTIDSLNIQNDSFVFKRDTVSNEAFSIAGTQLIKINNKTGTASRISGSPIDGGLRIQHNASVATTYGQLELQNFVVAAVWIRNTYLDIEYHCSIPTVLFFGVSTQADAGDFTGMYYAPKIVPANTYVKKQIKSSEFYKFNQYTNWHPTIADIPIYIYTGDGSVNFSFINDGIPNVIGGVDETLVLRVNLVKGTFAGFGLNNVQNLRRTPPKIYYKVVSGNIDFLVTDGNDRKFKKRLNTSNVWTLSTFSWSEFTSVTGEPFTDQVNIKGLEFEVDSSNAEIYIFTLGELPEKLPVPCYTYKTLIANRSADASVWIVGNGEIVNSSLNQLPYVPGVMPFTYNRIGISRYSWVREALTGYQSASMLQRFNLPTYTRQVALFWLAAQNSYTQNSPSGEIGLARQAYNWARWDAIAKPPFNVFLDTGSDPNVRWEGYQHRFIQDAAEAWVNETNEETKNLLATITMRFLRWIDKYWNLYGQPGRVPTDYIPPQFGLPQRNYTSPHGTALVLRAATDANLAGGDRLITFRTIVRCNDYLKTQFIKTGLMAGSWTVDQPNFVDGGNTYKEYFPFWHGEIMISLIHLYKVRNEIRLPSCKDWGL